MRGRIGTLELYMHPLLPLALLVMSQLGGGQECLLAFFCVLLHELGHLLAAHVLKLRALSLEVMPFGGVLRIGGLYRLPARQLAIVALAGPVTSLVLAALCFRIPSRMGQKMALIHLSLALFNLLPGLPLDGGRLLTALLKPLIGVRRAVNLAVYLGYGAGLLLLTGAALVWMQYGRLPFPLLLMGVFMLACAGRERRDCELSRAEDTLRLLQTGRLSRTTPVQAYAVAPHTPPQELLGVMRTDRFTLLAELDDRGEVARWRSDRELLRDMMASDGEGPPEASRN